MFVKYVIQNRICFLPNIITTPQFDSSSQREKPCTPHGDPVVAALVPLISSEVTDVKINLYWIKQDTNTRPSATF